MIEVGTVIDKRLRVDKVLGEGGMGVVVAATHLELGHKVAIKFLRDELAQNPEIVERFLREARAVVNLKTEHVCRVTDVGRLESGAPYIVMEMLEGTDLQRTVARSPLPVTTAVEYVLQACVAVAEAHHAGIIHRDLKPANLFVTRRMDGGPLIKVLDFGIAKAMAETSVHQTSQLPMGSPGYMSPEQIHSARDVDVRTDIWALGVTLYQLLSARLPFPASSLTEMAIRVGANPPDPLDVDPGLRAIVWRCLEKDRARRYPDVAELALDLARYAPPNVRHLATVVTQITKGHAPAMAPPVMQNAMTAATGYAPHMGAPTPAPMHHASTGPLSQPYMQPPRTSGTKIALIGVSVLAIVGAGIGIGYAVRGGGQSAPQVAGVRDAGAVAPVPVVAVDAAVEAPADAASLVDAGGLEATVHPPPKLPKQPKQPKQPKLPAAGSNAGSNAETTPPQKVASGSNTPTTTQPQNDQSVMHPVWEAACSKVSSRFAALAPPGLITKCMCLKGDKAAAQTAYNRISKDDRATPREECAKRGIKLTE